MDSTGDDVKTFYNLK